MTFLRLKLLNESQFLSMLVSQLLNRVISPKADCCGVTACWARIFAG
jgi:hypothetical protein